MAHGQGLSQVIDELVSAIELREGADPDSRDWTIETRIRTLEWRLVELHRAERQPYAVTVEDETPALAGMF
jgi:hypothetical protein